MESLLYHQCEAIPSATKRKNTKIHIISGKINTNWTVKETITHIRHRIGNRIWILITMDFRRSIVLNIPFIVLSTIELFIKLNNFQVFI